MRPDPARPGREQLLHRQIEDLRPVRAGLTGLQVEDGRRVLVVSPRRHTIRGRHGRVLVVCEQALQLVIGPEVELPLDPLGIGILCGVETPFRVGHVPEDVVEGLARDEGELLLHRRQPRFGVSRGQRRLVVEHLLEVGDEPAVVG